MMHITVSSGHHRASCAIQNTLTRLDPLAYIKSVDAFHYTSPVVRWAIHYLYYSLIRHQPDVWEYLYDNSSVHSQLTHLRALLHRYQTKKFMKLLESEKPDVIVCTQAYPCGMVADFKKHYGMNIPIVGILTDYAPHLYWFHDTVDVYVVPSEPVKQRFIEQGIEPSRVRSLGIPIDSNFSRPTDRQATARRYGLDLNRPILLIMGGGSGFGALREVVQNLDILPYPCQLVVITGTNRSLLSWIRARCFRHKVVGLGYVDDIAELMDIATLLISKPGGLTTSEALAKRVPLVIVNPIPGQESYNARFLLAQGAAVQAVSPLTVRQTVRDLLDNPYRMQLMRRNAEELAHPDATLAIGKLLCELADRSAAGDWFGGKEEPAPASVGLPES